MAEAPEEVPDQKLVFDLGDPIHDEDSKIGKFRNQAGALVNATIVQHFMTFFIVANAIRKLHETVCAMDLNSCYYLKSSLTL